jgi:hypothetical protein
MILFSLADRCPGDLQGKRDLGMQSLSLYVSMYLLSSNDHTYR